MQLVDGWPGAGIETRKSAEDHEERRANVQNIISQLSNVKVCRNRQLDRRT